jgi:hypothetical protein
MKLGATIVIIKCVQQRCASFAQIHFIIVNGKITLLSSFSLSVAFVA